MTATGLAVRSSGPRIAGACSWETVIALLNVATAKPHIAMPMMMTNDANVLPRGFFGYTSQ
jgi:hypothetical protein